ncbi:MAG: ATP-grasp domain-containing protein [Gammaproteobacteria bacterium]|nr:MAG: ATP-grasp domain-containing protein [Gammaproteobacteria bacterium]
MSQNPVIAITGMNAKPDNPGPGMAVARCIKESETFTGKIVGLSYDALDPGLYRPDYCESTYILPYPSSGEEALLERLTQIHEVEKIDILIPCLDAELQAIARLKPTLEEMGIKTLIPDQEQLKMRNKDSLPELARMAGIRTPDVTRVTSASFFYTCHNEGWHYPLVVKGLFYDAKVAYNADEAAAAFHKIAAEWGLPILVQQFVEGEEVNLTAIGDGNGNMLGSVMMKKRAITDKGKAWAGISIEDKKLNDAAAALIKASNWPGPLEVEVMLDTAGQYQLIEINPRFPAWIYLSVGVGRNLPYALIQNILGTTPEFPEYKVGTLFIRYAEELIVSLDEFESIAVNGHLGLNNSNAPK